MGSPGLLERLKQIRPRWVFFEDCAVYNGRYSDLREKMAEVVEGMSGVGEWKGVVSVPREEGGGLDVNGMQGVRSLGEFLGAGEGAPKEPEFNRVGFGEGLVIVYSSGTTGPPKW